MTISNLLLSTTIFVLFFVIFGNAQGTYLEYAQVPLYGIIFTEIALILVNRKFKNPLLDIINLIFVIFFILRVPVIYGDDLVSDIYFRNVNIEKVNYALYVLDYQLIVLSACVLLIRPASIDSSKMNITNDVWRRLLGFTSIILFLNIVYIATAFRIGESNLPSSVAIFFALFNWGSILILLVPLLVTESYNIEVKFRVFLYVELAICALLVMYTGSKSGLFQIVGIYLVSFLAIHGASYRISFRTLLICFSALLVAVVMYLLGGIFNKIQRSQVDLDNWYDLLILSLDNLSNVFNGLSFRIGYLDFYIDKLTQEVYASAFQLKYYIMAFIDAVTPGFDVFGGDVPLVSRAVYINYFDNYGGANSEVMTVFAEAHLLFGYFSFIAYLFVLSVILLVREYGFRFNTDYGKLIQRTFLCYIFYRYMLGIGIDYWLFGDVIYMIIFVALSFRYIGVWLQR